MCLACIVASPRLLESRARRAGLCSVDSMSSLPPGGASASRRHWRAADYVGRILKGAKAGDLPVQRLEKFQLVVNLKTERALQLTLPQSLVLRADRVIE
jgi:hypothetical protein